ncbi:trehalose 6-phosphatase [Paracoccus thiocyanatus]|uniref:Trehalose 6-phosphate phosphatase n=1 Tax=Paracoccus thiocyanatus TaxID=34006 RepID=A0A1N6N9B6_9RHOB|nr:trehalose-phosphatase [Paracoccus thiocyanatus]SIP88659.1 trehalose 6-phosphatase [Paracoccus thiocyanatus]
MQKIISATTADANAIIDGSLSDWAFFLDLDGTLLDLAHTPEAVVVAPGLRQTLARLDAATGGALAIVTGRSVGFAESLFPGQPLTLAGLHGAEMRLRQDHSALSEQPPPPSYAKAREMAQRAAQFLAGVLFEDKGAGFALHYRLAPDHAQAVARIMAQAAGLAGPAYALRPGKAVVELGPADANKGRAVKALMDMPPFLGRRPFAAGDDVTDEDMFRAVNGRGGLSMLVGSQAQFSRSAALSRLEEPADFRRWLGGLVP